MNMINYKTFINKETPIKMYESQCINYYKGLFNKTIVNVYDYTVNLQKKINNNINYMQI